MKKNLESTNTKGEKTRQRIYEATVTIFAKEGFYRATFEKIAKTCKLTPAAIIRHFPTKEILLKGVIEYVLKTNHGWMATEAHEHADKKLIRYFEKNLSWAQNHPAQAAVILLLYYHSSHDPLFREIYDRVLSTARDNIQAILSAGEREKIFHFKHLSPTDATEIFQELAIGSILNLVTRAKFSPSERQKFVRKIQTVSRLIRT